MPYISAGRSSSIGADHLCAVARRETTARTSSLNQTTQSTKRRARRSDKNGRLAVLLHDAKQTRRQGLLGLRLAKSSHPASGGGAGTRARARATALPVAAAAADGARSSAAPVGTRAARAIAATGGTSISAARAVAATSAASDADATQKEAAHRPDGLRRRVAAQEAAHGR